MVTAAFLIAAAQAELCPHAESRRGCTVVVFPPDAKPLGLCVLCLGTIRRLIGEWDRGELSVKELYAVFAGLGYSHEDAGRFLTETLEVAA
jgi:hypothetical protein